LKGRENRFRREPGEESPNTKGRDARNPGLFGRDTRGRKVERLSTDSATENQTAEIGSGAL